jgi:peroxiredoxin family protein
MGGGRVTSKGGRVTQGQGLEDRSQRRYEGPVPPTSDRVAVFLHEGAWDRVHQGLSVAASAVANGRRTDVFLFWWALERIARGELDEPDFGPSREDVADRFEALGMPSLRVLLSHLKESGLCTLYACSGSMAALGLRPPDLDGRVDQIVGWSSILQLTAGVTDRFQF